MTAGISPVLPSGVKSAGDAEKGVTTKGSAEIMAGKVPNVASSFRLSVINWLHIASLYIPHVLGVAFIASIACIVPPSVRTDAGELLRTASSVLSHVSSLWYAYGIIAACVYWLLSVKPSVYCVDFAVYTPPAEWVFTQDELVEMMRRLGVYSEDSLAFMRRMLERSGTGDRTAWPGSIGCLIRPELTKENGYVLPATAAASHYDGDGCATGKGRCKGAAAPSAVPAAVASPSRGGSGSAAAASSDAATASSAGSEAAAAASGSASSKGPVADFSIDAARMNAERVMFSVVGDVLAKTKTRARDVDFLIVNCSMFCPTPSLCSSIARHFGMRSDVRSYNLGGMGCSAGVVSIDLARQLLQNKPGSRAIVVSFEDISQQLYQGNTRSMLLQNTLFRVGGSAVLLSNRPMDGFRAKYRLLHTVRVQDTSEAAHRCVYSRGDEEGKMGIELSKDITTIAAKTLRDNLTLLGPHVLPIREQAKVLLSVATRRVITALNDAADRFKVAHLPLAPVDGPTPGRYAKPTVYVPDFKLGLQHFCIHAGGRAVIDGIEANLRLQPYHTAPSRATLRTFGNTSSSSIWYEMAFVEGEEARFRLPLEEGGGHNVKRGQRVVQLAFGSGFKTNSAVWLRIR